MIAAHFGRLLDRISGKRAAHWNAASIQDEWFDSHFHYAADVVANWLGHDRLKAGTLLDFGCGDGITMLGLVLRHGAHDVLGADVSHTHLGLKQLARREIGLRELPARLHFKHIQPGERISTRRRFDMIISWSTFEHVDVSYLDGILANLSDVLADDGVVFLQINPLYYSPYGSHLGRFELPAWAHLLWAPDRLREAVLAFSGDIPREEVEENFHTRDFAAYKRFVLNEYEQLNRLTASNLVSRLRASGLEVEREEYGRVQTEPPAVLLAQYGRDDLMIEEIRLLLRKRA